jgi:hypothetical protein
MSNSDNNNSNGGKKRRQGFNPIFYCAAGAYLVYLGYKMLKEILDSGEISVKWYFAAVGAIFVIGGIWAVVYGLRTYKIRKQMQADEAAAAIEEQRRLDEEERAQNSQSSGMGYVEEDPDTGKGYAEEDSADEPDDDKKED